MMKSFFKKLAFVMALAMVVSMAAPAGAVYAATEGISLEGVVYEKYTLGIGDSADFGFTGYEGWTKGTPCKWESSNPAVASVDTAGVVTGLSNGVTTITVTVNNTWVKSMVVTVTDFAVEMVSDGVARLATSLDVTAAELLENLEFYYYVAADYAVSAPLVKEVKEEAAGTFKLTMYDGFTFADGVVYGFKYGENYDEFTCVIGDVEMAVLKIAKHDSLVVELNEDGYDFDVVFYNAQGKDITTTAKAAGVYAEYVVVEDESNKFCAAGEAGILFDEPATAKVQLTCYKLNEDYEAVTVVDTLDYYVTAVTPTPYAIDFVSSPAFTVAQDISSVNWNKATNSKLAVGDENYQLLVKLTDNRGNEIATDKQYYKNGLVDDTNSFTEGEFRFASTNVARLYVTDEGVLMPNAGGEVTVLVYFKPNVDSDEKVTEKLVSAVKLNVSSPRSVGTVTSTIQNRTLSTQEVNNANVATVTFDVKDTLGDKIGVEGATATIKCTTQVANLKNNAIFPDLSAESAKVVDGKVTFTITATPGTLTAAGKNQSYNYEVKIGKKTQTFSITVKCPSDLDSFASYTLVFGNVNKIEDGTQVTDIQLPVTLAGMSNGVAAAKLDIAGPRGKAEQATLGKYYYTVTKNGDDITSKSTITTKNGDLYIDITNSKTEKYQDHVNAATSSVINMTKVDLTHGAGQYKVTIYEAKLNSKDEVYFKQITRGTYNVDDKLPSLANSVTKISPKWASSKDIVGAVKNCFEFKIGDKTFKTSADYFEKGDLKGKELYKIEIDENFVAGGNVCYINSVTFYKLSADGISWINCGKVDVNDYITFGE